jgi:hypothetical protein
MKKFPPYEIHKLNGDDYKVIKYPKFYVVVRTTPNGDRSNYKIMQTLERETMSQLKQKAYDKFGLSNETLVETHK